MTNNTITGSAIPIGLIVGSATIQSSHSVSLVFTVVGIVLVILPIVFSRTALGRADKYMSPSSNV